MKPKYTVPVERISAVTELDVEDRKRNKKFYHEGIPAFKVSFDNDYLKKGDFNFSNSDDSGDD